MGIDDMFFPVRSGLRLLSRTRQRLWQRRTAVSTAEESVAEGSVEPPNGFLFNEKSLRRFFRVDLPLLPGEKRQKEPWENIYVFGMTFNLLLVLGICIFKPDTSVSSWGRQKALERLASRDAEASDQQIAEDDS